MAILLQKSVSCSIINYSSKPFMNASTLHSMFNLKIRSSPPQAAQESTTHKLLLNERLQHHVLRQASEQAAIRHADIEVGE